MYNFALKKLDFREWWFQTPKNRVRSKKTQGRTGLKNGGVSLVVGSYLQRGSAPPGREAIPVRIPQLPFTSTFGTSLQKIGNY